MQFNDLTHALKVMGHTATVPSPAEKLLLVWLLDNRSLHFDYQSQVMTLKWFSFDMFNENIFTATPSSEPSKKKKICTYFVNVNVLI